MLLRFYLRSRNQFEIDEGDPFNEILFNKTLNNIKSLGFFKKAEGEIQEIKGDNAEYNANKFIEMIDGKNQKFQQIVEINAGAALYLSKKAKNLKEGFDMARNVINKKITKNYLEKIIS